MSGDSTFEICAGKGCKNAATEFLRIDLINKGGWFCKPCKKELEKSGLIVSVESNR
jgi:hypothetical protein